MNPKHKWSTLYCTFFDISKHCEGFTGFEQARKVFVFEVLEDLICLEK